MSATPLDAETIKRQLTQSGVEAVLRQLGVERLQSYGRENWLVSATYREDRHPSLSVQRDSGVWNDKSSGEAGDLFDLVMTTTGGTFTEALRFVAEAAGIGQPMRSETNTIAQRAWDGMAHRPENRPKRAPIVACYPYPDENSDPLYTVHRNANKSFYPAQPNGAKGYGPRRVLYNLPAVVASPFVIVVEGEKDADRVAALGLQGVAVTTSPGGSNAWRPEYVASLAGKRVAILGDNDEPGWKYAQTVAASISGQAASVQIVELPDLGPRLDKGGKDISNWLDAGHTTQELVQLIQDAPAWTPQATNGTASVTDFTGPALVIRPVSDYESQAVDWFWQRWLARRKVVIYAGVEGDGKSYSLTDIIARLTRGASMPDGFTPPRCRVLMLIAEDGIEDTIRPRLERHNADLEQVLILAAVRVTEERETMFSLAQHLPLLEAAVAEHDIDVIVIDPLSSFLQKADRNDEGAVRDLLTPLTQLADRTGVAVIGVAHMNRPNGTNRRATQRILGSTAFGAVARLVWMIAPKDEPDDPTRRVLGVVKSNLAMKPTALEWSIPAEDAAIEWHGESDVMIEQLLDGRGAGSHGGGLSPEREDIVDLLENASGGLSPTEIAAELKKNVSTTKALLKKMLEDSQVVRLKTGIYGIPGRDYEALSRSPVVSVVGVVPDEHNDATETTETMKTTGLRHSTSVVSASQAFCRECGALLPNQQQRDAGLCSTCTDQAVA